MKVILLVDIPKVGRKFEEKNVADGFARNTLIPQGKVVMSASMNPKKLKELKEQVAKKATKKVDDLTEALKHIPDHTITIKVKANESGHLFASINSDVLSKEIENQFKVSIPAELFDLPKPIKEVGEREVGFSVPEKTPILKVVILSK